MYLEEFIEDIDNEDNETVEDMTFNPERFQQAVIWGTDWTTETINNQLVKGNINLNPSFQRRDAWTDGEKSKLIESLMLGIPVPPIILAEDKKKKNSYIVIDGKQRLLSIRRFFADDSSDFAKLKLRSLDIITELNGCTFNDVQNKAADYITNLENQPIRTIVIKNWPDEPFLYMVFLRLNTGSKKLSPQELRQALKPGRFLDYLDEATANSESIRKMLNNKSADTRMKDIEIALRYYAFKYYFDQYTGNLKDFLDLTCDRLNKSWDSMEEQIKIDFENLEKIINFSYQLMETRSPFSRYENEKSLNRFNKSIFELFSFYFVNPKICELVMDNKEVFKKNFIEMNADIEFKSAIGGSTKDPKNVNIRFEKFYNLLSSLPNATDIDIQRVLFEDGKFSVKKYR